MSLESRFPRLIFLPLLGLLLAPGSAHAHTKLLRSVPAAGAVVDAAPVAVDLWFGERIQAPLSTVEVLGPGGRSVRAEDPAVTLDGPKSLRAPLRSGLGPGTYDVRWSVISADGHRQQGSFRFELKGAAGPPLSPSGSP